MSSERGGGGGFGAAFVLLIVVGVIAEFFWVIVAVLGALVLSVLLWWLMSRAADHAAERYAKRGELATRADQQHAWVLDGDDRGIYGDYRPEVYPSTSG